MKHRTLFPIQIQKPQRSAFIRFFLNDHEIYQLDSLSSDVTIGVDRTILHFRIPDVVLSMRGTYYILMDPGVVVAAGCASGGLPSLEISSSSDWSFYTSGACSSGFYLGPPGFYDCQGKLRGLCDDVLLTWVMWFIAPLRNWTISPMCFNQSHEHSQAPRREAIAIIYQYINMLLFIVY